MYNLFHRLATPLKLSRYMVTNVYTMYMYMCIGQMVVDFMYYSMVVLLSLLNFPATLKTVPSVLVNCTTESENYYCLVLHVYYMRYTLEAGATRGKRKELLERLG